MANCNWRDGACDQAATTTLTKNSGEVVQLCEAHRNLMIKIAKVYATNQEDGEIEANHWLVKNKIPS
jgi:hypothetical protein